MSEMLNQVVLVGRLVDNLKVEDMDGKKYCNLILAVPRSYKNENGEYETDFIDCILWHSVAENTAEYCKKGDLVGIKGRLEKRENNLFVIGEKVSFLSSKRVDENENN
jgi:single-strand DNA-binding protein